MAVVLIRCELIMQNFDYDIISCKTCKDTDHEQTINLN